MNPMPAMPRAKRERKSRPIGGPHPDLTALPPMPSMKPEPVDVDRTPAWHLNPDEEIVGTCKKCGREVRAMGLIPVADFKLFGRDVEGGWYCSECRPRRFGRVNGQPAIGLRGL